MKKNYYVFIAPLLFCMRVVADPTITFFFRPFVDMHEVHKNIRKPGKLAKHTVHGIVSHAPVAGILVTYAGYVTASSYNGEVVLPRKHQKPNVTILVTSEMAPIALFENTILHWQLIPGIPAQMYTCELQHNEKTGRSYWDTQEIALPENNVIPLSAIVITADPKNITLPTGQIVTNETANLVLPDISVKKGINIVKNDTYMLTVRHLFKPVDTQEKREPLKMITHIVD
ncbi:MAG TPA: hypothetical protein VHX42_01410 [Candidatus Babeliales bacterium]|nr:hypothetical protein [Candidatus Babeliales bacterium]